MAGKVSKPAGKAAAPKVRLMIPFTMKCTLCGNYIPKRRKFNARKEVAPETYLGAKIYRFHVNCPGCAGDIVFRTNPRDGDYLPDTNCAKVHVTGGATTVQVDAPAELMDETLHRLEQQESQHQQWQQEQEARKRNGGLLPENYVAEGVDRLEARVQQQQREHMLREELEELRGYRQSRDRSPTPTGSGPETLPVSAEPAMAAKPVFPKPSILSKRQPRERGLKYGVTIKKKEP